ncbi:MAG: hypothetical protein LC795_05785 [Acidobacteria bacterium]|nr:hypothetical protein [Acidobacteriota bacterium]
MSDEKRQTRLLPFRLRRAGAGRASRGARDAEDFGADAGLTALLRTWEAPPRSDVARARLLADFRATARPAPLWRRAFAAQVRVPLPVAACAVLALLLSPLAFGARPWTQNAPAAGAEVAPAETVRVVEVPVVQERVVTRTVYVEKKERGRERGVSPRADASARPAAPETASAKPAERRGEDGQTPASPDASAGYFSRVNMEDFQPADEMKIRVVKRGGVDEK